MSKNPPPSHNNKKYEQLAFLHLISDIEVSRYDTDSQTFVLSNSVKEYDSILKEILPEEFWPPLATHSTRLNQILLAELSDLQFFKRDKMGYLGFN